MKRGAKLGIWSKLYFLGGAGILNGQMKARLAFSSLVLKPCGRAYTIPFVKQPYDLSSDTEMNGYDDGKKFETYLVWFDLIVDLRKEKKEF